MERLNYEIHKLEGQRIPVICKLLYGCKHMGSYLNWHENLELLYCLEGSGSVLVGGVPYAFAPGDLVAVNANEIHRVTTEESLRYYVLIVDQAFLLSSGIPVDQLEFQSRISSPEVQKRYLETVKACEESDPFTSAAVRGNVLQLLVWLGRHHAVSRPVSRGDQNVGIKRAIAYIQSNYAESMTLEELAGHAGLSRYHFSRTFKTVTGETVTDFINGVRCRYAQKMLLQGDVSVRQAAEACGFENRSYFAKTFQKFIGCLPSELLRT